METNTAANETVDNGVNVEALLEAREALTGRLLPRSSPGVRPATGSAARIPDPA